jgi:hypothetical protein
MAMKKILSIPAYMWAVTCFLMVPVTFIKNDAFAEQLAKLPFMRIHPKYNGGELNRNYENDGLSIKVNMPVYAALFGESNKGFMQVTFSALAQLPEQIDQTIDYNFDSSPDFKVSINTLNGETNLIPLDQTVKSLYASSKVKDSWVIRVNLEK